MSHQEAGFQLEQDASHGATVLLSGNWVRGGLPADYSGLEEELLNTATRQLTADGSQLGDWDSALVAFLLRCHNTCESRSIGFSTLNMPEGIDRLLDLATTVKPHKRPEEQRDPWFSALSPAKLLGSLWDGLGESFVFIGDATLALVKMMRGKANTRWVDFWNCCYQAGPDAFAIISLTSILVGMILAYLGAVQLRQFGAEIYVADLVVIGMLREMGVLMTAIVMAGRTGAAYAAQLGTMQTNEEIDAIRTMGVSPMEFLVLPRMLALVAVMPLLTIYADVLGILGGSIVSTSMGISPAQYLNESQSAMSAIHIGVGLIKSVVFGILIAVAGCRAGMNSGRSSAAVGQAATRAVVTAIVYLIVADAAINIIFQQLNL